MNRNVWWKAAVGACIALASAGRADEAAVVEKLKMMKAQVTVDDNQPDKPVIAVALELGPGTESVFKDLKELKNLQSLNLGFVRITDAGLKNLKDLEKLRSLSITKFPSVRNRAEINYRVICSCTDGFHSSIRRGNHAA